MRSTLVPFLFTLAACGVSSPAPDTGSEAPASGGYSFGGIGSSGSTGSTDTDTDSTDTADSGADDTADSADTAEDTSACTEIVWYLDADNDGFGLTASSTWSCTQPSGYVAIGGDLNDSDNDVHDVTRICTVTSAAAYSVAVLDMTSGDSTYWFASDGTVPTPLYTSDLVGECAEYPGSTGHVLKLSGLSTTTDGYGDFSVYACGGLTGNAVFYDGNVTCAVVQYSVNGYDLSATAYATYGSYEYLYTP